MQENENLFSLNFANQNEIDENINLIYTKTIFSFQFNLNDNHIDIFTVGKLSDLIYEEYYKRHVFYDDLLVKICDKISSKFINLPVITAIDSEYNILNSDDLIDKNKLIYLNDNTYYVADSEIWKLVIYQQEIYDDFGHHAILNSLTYQVLSDDIIKNIIETNINETAQLSKIYLDSTNQIIKNYLLESICQNQTLISKYQELIINNFDKCINYLITNKIWIEFIYQNFGEQLTNDYLIEIIPTNYKNNLLQELQSRQIISPQLELLLINRLNLNYENSQTYLVNSKLEQEILKVINEVNKVILATNTFNEDNLSKTYIEINQVLDKIDSFINDKKVTITCLTNSKSSLERKLAQVRDQLGAHNIKELRGTAGENRDLLEGDIWNLIFPKQSYDEKSFKKIGEYCLANKIMTHGEINELIKGQEFNNEIMHHQNNKGLAFLDDKKYYAAKDKLKK